MKGKSTRNAKGDARICRQRQGCVSPSKFALRNSPMKYRRLRMQDLFREEISEIIQQEMKDPGIGFITILDVRLTEDLKVAKVLYSVYGSEDEKYRTVDALRRAKGYIKHVLGTRVKLRFMPDITFVLDTGQEKQDRIDEIFKKVDAERVSDVPED